MFNTFKFVIFLRSRINRYNTFFDIDVKTNTLKILSLLQMFYFENSIWKIMYVGLALKVVTQTF